MRLLLEVFIYLVNILKEYAAVLVEVFIGQGFIAIPLFILATVWVFYCLKKNKLKILVIPFIVIEILCALLWGSTVVVTHDESEHLHCAWLVSKGMLPYKDFWQHHFPTLWVILAFFIKGLKATTLVFPLSRLLCGALFIGVGITGWRIAKQTWGEKANLPFYIFLLLSGDFLSNFIYLRPLCFMIFFLLLGVYFTMTMSKGHNLPPFLAGALIALGLTFDAREFIFITLPIPFILLEDKKLILRRLALFVAGIFVAVIPLLAYVVKNNILEDFVFWAFLTNYYKFNVYLPALLFGFFIAALIGWFLLRWAYRRISENKSPLLLGTAVLYSVFMLTSLGSIPHYYLFSCFFLVVIFLSRYPLAEILKSMRLGSVKKSLIGGLIVTFIVLPNFRIHDITDFKQSISAISKLMKLCQKDSCVVLAPLNPIFAYDSIGLYSQWQFSFLESMPEARGYVTKNGIAGQIMTVKPAVMSYEMGEKEIFATMAAMKLMSESEAADLADFLEENYTVQIIGRYKFYIRNDKNITGGV